MFFQQVVLLASRVLVKKTSASPGVTILLQQNNPQRERCHTLRCDLSNDHTSSYY